MGRPWVSTSSSSRQIVSWASTVSCSTSFLILTSSQNGFLVNVRSFFVDFYLCHFLVAEGSFLGETGVPASAGVTRSITTRSFQLVPKPVPSRFQHVCQSLLLLPCGGFVVQLAVLRTVWGFVDPDRWDRTDPALARRCSIAIIGIAPVIEPHRA